MNRRETVTQDIPGNGPDYLHFEKEISEKNSTRGMFLHSWLLFP